jgi:hypothetical protein
LLVNADSQTSSTLNYLLAVHPHRMSLNKQAGESFKDKKSSTNRKSMPVAHGQRSMRINQSLSKQITLNLLLQSFICPSFFSLPPTFWSSDFSDLTKLTKKTDELKLSSGSALFQLIQSLEAS